MHKYLRAIGFSNIKSHADVENMLEWAEKNISHLRSVQLSFEESYRQSYTMTGDKTGVSSCGVLDKNDNYHREFYFPYLAADEVSTEDYCEIQRHSDKESYSGMCDEYKLGISLIFYLQNGTEYLMKRKALSEAKTSAVMLGGLSVVGEIILPVKKTVKQAEKIKKDSIKRKKLFEAAKQGSESAIETLTMEDMDIFSRVNERIVNEDIYSIVDTCFLPHGVECDHYSVVGEIIGMDTDTNIVTGEKIYIFTLECNTMVFQVCINREDLLGEPAVGRRFKGIIWMQGAVKFAEE